MNRSKLISLLICISLLLSAIVLLASCDSGKEMDNNTTTTQEETTTAIEETTDSTPKEKVEYTLTFVSEGKLSLANVEFEVYSDEGMTSLKAYNETNKTGKATIKLTEGETYYVKVISAPDGYKFEESYTLTDRETSITLKSYLREDAPTGNFAYQLGDVVHDFVLTGSGDNAIKVSDVLDQYGCVIINLWYIGCSPCRAEFPYIQSAYNAYSDKVGFYALNGNAMDSDSAIADFMSQNGYTFPTGKADSLLLQNFGITAFPTTIVIDKYGVVCLLETGAVPEEAPFVNMFEFFSNPNYSETTLFPNIEYIPAK